MAAGSACIWRSFNGRNGGDQGLHTHRNKTGLHLRLLSALTLKDENPSRGMLSFSGVCVRECVQVCVALHLLNQSGAVFTDTQLPPDIYPSYHLPACFFLHVRIQTPQHTHIHILQRNKPSWVPLRCVCVCVSILHVQRIDCMHKVKRTSHTRALWQGSQKYSKRDSVFIIFMRHSRRAPACVCVCVCLSIITCLCNVLCVPVAQIYGRVIVRARIQARSSFNLCQKKKKKGRFFRVG